MKETTTKKLLYQEKLLSLYAYETEDKPLYKIPVVLIPPLMISSSLFDLTHNYSFAKTLAESGFKVYLVDFGRPNEHDSEIGLDVYLLDMLYRSVYMVKKHSQVKQVTLLGYGLGGIFACSYASTSIDIKDDVKNVIAISSPIDFKYLKKINPWKKILNYFVSMYGYLPYQLAYILYRLADPFSFIKRPIKLFANRKDKRFVERYIAINNFYTSFCNLSKKAFNQVFEIVESNKLIKGNLQLMDVNIDFCNFKANLLTICGSKDIFVPKDSATYIHKCINVSDATHDEVPLGHFSIMTGLKAEELTWTKIISWLEIRSQKQEDLGKKEEVESHRS